MPEPLINPFESLRKDAGLTLGELSTRSYIDIRALSRSEAGMYTNPLPALVNYWLDRGKITEGTLVSEYEDYVFNTRRRNRQIFGEALVYDVHSRSHILRQLRNGADLGLIEVCRSLCIPLDTVQFFEKKWRTQKSVPKTLLAALNQNGYSQDTLKKFQEDYKEWRNQHMGVRFS